uniref:SIMPL domain-containing protein n=1 Tax=Desertifilum tharense IPPAS B-1220 TaxID=1781255 RepID=A0ACD5GVX5_9CYAN
MHSSVPSKFLSSSWVRLSVLPLAAAGVLGITLTATGVFSTSRPVVAQERTMRTLTVSGQGIERIPTTITQVQLGVEVQGRTSEEVQREVARRSSAVVELLKARNVEKLETTGVRLNPVYDYSGNTQRLTGYTGVNTVSFRVNTERAGTLIDDAVKAGATRVDGVNFTATDSAIADAQKQALRRATQDAQQQADAVLESLNLRRRDIVSIQINNASAPPPPMFRGMMNMVEQAADAKTPIVGGEQQVNAIVTLEIQY